MARSCNALHDRVTLLYFDLRVRREAFDLEVRNTTCPCRRARRAEPRPPPAAPLPRLPRLLQPCRRWRTCTPTRWRSSTHSLVKEGLNGRPDAAQAALAVLFPRSAPASPRSSPTCQGPPITRRDKRLSRRRRLPRRPGEVADRPGETDLHRILSQSRYSARTPATRSGTASELSTRRSSASSLTSARRRPELVLAPFSLLGAAALLPPVRCSSSGPVDQGGQALRGRRADQAGDADRFAEADARPPATTRPPCLPGGRRLPQRSAANPSGRRAR